MGAIVAPRWSKDKVDKCKGLNGGPKRRGGTSPARQTAIVNVGTVNLLPEKKDASNYQRDIMTQFGGRKPHSALESCGEVPVPSSQKQEGGHIVQLVCCHKTTSEQQE